MSNKKKKPKDDGSVLPARQVMSLISPGSSAVPGLGGLIGGTDPMGTVGPADPTAGAGTPESGTTDLASGIAQHAADGQQPTDPQVTSDPVSTSSASSETASSET